MNDTLPAVADTAPAPTAEPQRDAVAELVAWAESARAAFAIAESLARTSFVPEAFRGKPHEVTAAILTGNEMGLSPMAALRSIDLIKGTPAMRAHAMRALVQSHGHAIWEEESTATRAVVCGRRAGESEVHRAEWTIERARDAGLTGKDNWKRDPKGMLVARASSEVCRLTASDVLHGIPYSAEELADGSAGTTRTVRRRRKPTPVQPEIAKPSAEGSPHVTGTQPPPPEGAPDRGAQPSDAEAPLWGTDESEEP